MNRIMFRSLRGQLVQRRQVLQATIAELGQAEDLSRLLVEVDHALERLGTDAFGRCELCRESMDDWEMRENPLRRYCLCDLTAGEQTALQRDLDLAWQIQASLLPAENLSFGGWQTHYRYQPVGPVSGDYCDIVTHEQDGWLYFLVGDVSGKGVAASYLMAHLSALVRRSLDAPLPVESLMEIVNRHLSERSADTHFVTLVAGRGHVSGRVEISNAGHCRPLLLRKSGPCEFDSTGIPIGIADGVPYQSLSAELSDGDSLILYSDGLTESRNAAGELYGDQSLIRVAAANRDARPTQLAGACVVDAEQFRGAEPRTDDLTLMVLRRGR